MTLDGGFADPVLGAQSAFRALMDALANPGALYQLPVVSASAGLAPELAAIALTLCDHDTPIWLGPTLAGNDAVVSWLRFQTGAPLATDRSRAQFALVDAADHLPLIDSFALGSDEYPDRSTTIALQLPSLTGGPPLTLRGPGIKGTRTISPIGISGDLLVQWGANATLFPRGVDLLLVAGGQVIGLPRTARISEG